jgi:SAM-dependent methyltransferase
MADEDTGSVRDNAPSFSSLRATARSIYGADARGYAAGRPDYPEHVYEVLRQRCGLRNGSHVLDIGAGTGLVTARLLAGGARVVAVEPDPAMASHLRQAASGPLVLSVDTFEQALLPEGDFDLAVAATSFHWIDQAEGIPKLGGLLRPGGWVAMWWTIFDDPDADDPFRNALGQRWGQEDPGGQRNVAFQMDTAARSRDLRDLGGFEDVIDEVIRWRCELTTAQLSALYGSMINIRRLPANNQRALLDTIEELAEAEFGGMVRRPFVTVMYTARRPEALAS